MENNKDKYKGFANAAEYVQDIHNRYAALKQKMPSISLILNKEKKVVS